MPRWLPASESRGYCCLPGGEQGVWNPNSALAQSNSGHVYAVEPVNENTPQDMKMKYFFLALPIVLAACAAPVNTTQGTGFSNSSGGNRSYQASQPSAPVTLDKRALRQAAESSLRIGYGTRRDNVPVSVAGRSMGMRVVNVKGQNFAILQEKGIPFSLKGQPNLLSEAQTVAQNSSGCLATGNTWTKRYSNGAFPHYIVHLQCS